MKKHLDSSIAQQCKRKKAGKRQARARSNAHQSHRSSRRRRWYRRLRDPLFHSISRSAAQRLREAALCSLPPQGRLVQSSTPVQSTCSLLQLAFSFFSCLATFAHGLQQPWVSPATTACHSTARHEETTI
jgi:hypothetical protein